MSTPNSSPKITDSGLALNDSTLLRWEEMQSFHAKTTTVFSIKTDRKTYDFFLPEGQGATFIDSLFDHWISKAPSKGKKAAFDYFSDQKGLYWVFLIAAFAFCGGIATIFLADGIHTWRCNNYLTSEQTGFVPAEVLKIKKDRRGQYIWDLKFQTTSGLTIQGKRSALWYDKDGKPLSPVHVIYSEENLKCWDVSLSSEEKKLPNAQRWFIVNMTMGFGSFFAFLTLVLVLWSVRKLLQPRPYREAASKAYQKFLV